MGPGVSDSAVALDAGRILISLHDAEVDFVVIGGIASVLHGSARNTFDLDICFATDARNLERLGSVLVRLKARLRGAPGDVPFIPDACTLQQSGVLTLTTIAGDLDVLARQIGRAHV